MRRGATVGHVLLGAGALGACGAAVAGPTRAGHEHARPREPRATAPHARGAPPLARTSVSVALPSAPAARAAASTFGSRAQAGLPPAPAIHQWPIPFGPARKREMAAYSLRHYGEGTYVLRHPQVIVEHYTETTSALAAYNTFAPDVPDSEFGVLPNTCAHFLVEPGGRIDQLVSLRIRCRHTTGLNWTAIGIENVGLSDGAILARPSELSASLALTRWLRCRYGIALRDVIGHNESLSSPYHRDLVPAFQHQTHSDWRHADMQVYRARLARLGC
jgi:N-acetylmuramoyl-L-alanine amidase